MWDNTKFFIYCTAIVEIKLEHMEVQSWVAFIPWLLQRYDVERCQILEW